jgi:hypothetical protein
VVGVDKKLNGVELKKEPQKRSSRFVPNVTALAECLGYFGRCMEKSPYVCWSDAVWSL